MFHKVAIITAPTTPAVKPRRQRDWFGRMAKLTRHREASNRNNVAGNAANARRSIHDKLASKPRSRKLPIRFSRENPPKKSASARALACASNSLSEPRPLPHDKNLGCMTPAPYLAWAANTRKTVRTKLFDFRAS